MATEREVELAILAYDAYLMSDINLVPLAGWTRDELLDPENPVDGFGAAVYFKGDEVVVSFRGTDSPHVQDFLKANIPIGVGLRSEQVRQAIEVVSDAMAKYGENVTFTVGRSIGDLHEHPKVTQLNALHCARAVDQAPGGGCLPHRKPHTTRLSPPAHLPGTRGPIAQRLGIQIPSSLVAPCCLMQSPT